MSEAPGWFPERSADDSDTGWGDDLPAGDEVAGVEGRGTLADYLRERPPHSAE